MDRASAKPQAAKEDSLVMAEIVPALGLNLAAVEDGSTEVVFLDAIKMARPWSCHVRGRLADRLLYLACRRLGLGGCAARLRGRVWRPGGELDLDSHGNVRSLSPSSYAEAILWSGPDPRFPAGTYLCPYEGEGHLDFAGDLRVVGRKAGELWVELRLCGTGALARLNGVDPNNPLRNIRLVPSELAADDAFLPFHPDFLRRWHGFKVFRFRDWQRTNDVRGVEWDYRPTPADHSQTVKGVALEHMVQLCNRLSVEPWFCMPHAACDDYVRRFAQLVKSDLDPSLRVHVEYSNECWNAAFPQARYCRVRGFRLGLGESGESQLQFYSQRAVEVFTLWEEVFGGVERLVRVLAAGAANPRTAAVVLDWKDAWKHADALAIAPYFGRRWGSPKTIDRVATMTPDDLIARLREDVATSSGHVSAHVAEAEKRGLGLVAYEGGQHLVGHGGAENDERLTRLFVAANRHPGMRELYGEHLRNWAAAGGGLFCLFSSMSAYGTGGCWGLLEHGSQDPERAPKHQAIQELLGRQPADACTGGWRRKS